MTDTLMNLIDAYAETRNRCWGGIYNAKTDAARKAVIEALSWVQTLQPAPAPLSDDVEQKTWALIDELEKLRAADRYDEDWVTLNKRDSELRAALDAQGGKV